MSSRLMGLISLLSNISRLKDSKKRIQILNFLVVFALWLGTPFSSYHAQAGDVYVSGQIGKSFVQESDITDTFTSAGNTVVATGEVGMQNHSYLSLSGALGYALENFRIEAELSRLNTDLRNLKVSQATAIDTTVTINQSTSLKGDYDATNFMANGWYEISVNPSSRIVPFLGGGVGLSRIKISVDTVADLNITYDETDTVFAYQIGGGVGYKISEKTTLDFSYRCFISEDPQFNDGADKIDMEFLSHNIWVGVTKRF